MASYLFGDITVDCVDNPNVPGWTVSRNDGAELLNRAGRWMDASMLDLSNLAHRRVVTLPPMTALAMAARLSGETAQ